LLEENAKYESVNGEMDRKMPEIKTTPRLKVIQETDIKDKVVLVRVDHNVVKQGEIKDPSRIDSSLGTLKRFSILQDHF